LQLLPLTPEQIHLVLRAMKAVALANGAFSDEERALLGSVSEALRAGVDVLSIEPAEPAAVASAFRTEEERDHVIQMLVFTAMIDGDAGPAETSVIHAFADALGVEPDFIHDVRRLAAMHLNTLRLDIVRRLPPPAPGAPEAREDEGWRGLWKVFGAASRSGENPDVAWRYKSLGLLPDGTLGRAYWVHMTDRRLLFPGERGAIIPGSVHHDFTRVLCGYGTDAMGEVEMTAFTAGVMKLDDPFGMLFGTLCMVHLGEKLLLPGAAGAGVPSMRRPEIDPARVAAAFRRGLLAAVDFTDGWDYWADVARPVDELQRHYTIFTGS
jgi:tellurite resistance protein